MEADIDIRGQILTVLRSWKLIIGLAILAAAAAAAYAWTLPDTYEAEALVSMSSGRVVIDLAGVSQSGSVPVQSYVELAESSSVAQAILDAAGPEGLGPIQSLGQLRGYLSAEAASNAPLMRLQVTDSDPERAALIANFWAAAFTQLAGQLYGQDRANLALFAEAEAEAKATLEAATSDLAAFQSGNRLNILQAQLNSQQASLSDYLNRTREAGLLGQDVQDLLLRLESLPANTPASLSDDLALLALTSRVYGGQLSGTAGGLGSGGGDTVVQVQLSGDESLTNGTVSDQRELAQTLLATLETRRETLATLATEVEPAILTLQGEVAEVRVQEQRLASARDLAAQLYNSRALQVREADLAVRQAANVAQIASLANVPTLAAGPARTTYILLGGALGAGLGVVLALAREFLRPAAARAEGAPASATAVSARTS